MNVLHERPDAHNAAPLGGAHMKPTEVHEQDTRHAGISLQNETGVVRRVPIEAHFHEHAVRSGDIEPSFIGSPTLGGTTMGQDVSQPPQSSAERSDVRALPVTQSLDTCMRCGSGPAEGHAAASSSGNSPIDATSHVSSEFRGSGTHSRWLQEKKLSDKKLFIGQLPRSWTEENLFNIMSPFGDISDIMVLRNSRTFVSRGCGFCTFVQSSAASAAREALHGTRPVTSMRNGLQIKFAAAQRDSSRPTECSSRSRAASTSNFTDHISDAEGATNSPGSPAESTMALANPGSGMPPKLFIGQLPGYVTEVELAALLNCYGRVLETRVLRRSGRSQGCAFARFATSEEAILTIQSLDGFCPFPGHRPLNVRFAHEKHRMPAGADQQDRPANYEETTLAEEAEDQPLDKSSSIEQPSDGLLLAEQENTSQALSVSGHDVMQTSLVPQGNYPSNPAALNLVMQQRALAATSGYDSASRDTDSTSVWVEPARAYSKQSPAAAPGRETSHRSPQQLSPERDTNNSSSGSSFPRVSGWQQHQHQHQQKRSNEATLSKQQKSGRTSQRGWPNAMGGGSRTVGGPPGCNIFIFNIPIEWDDSALAGAFSIFGRILSSKVYVDKKTGRSKCFGFISFDHAHAAATAIAAMDGFTLPSGRTLEVSLKRESSRT
ncbi:CUGBP Elav-like family member 5 [Porphyridium purpureum]|uniref:CUGBP Elav-like family member 5 n=1 Tax=Porphyridium purpureum TaxID=35688 RepID=A0A5J4YT66_PORPP|nr:CUGBP Elav-like family member 5 [Porphyridium purpureum]|eukprot:POR2816..scf229_5